MDPQGNFIYLFKARKQGIYFLFLYTQLSQSFILMSEADMPIPIWHSQKSRELLMNFRETEPCPVSEHVNTRALIYPAAFSLRQGCETSSTRLVYLMTQGLINQ